MKGIKATNLDEYEDTRSVKRKRPNLPIYLASNRFARRPGIADKNRGKKIIELVSSKDQKKYGLLKRTGYV